MFSSLVDDIINYLDYLKHTHQLEVTIHDSSILRKYYNRLLPYIIHKNAYCAFLKTNNEIFRQCCYNKRKVTDKAKQGEFFGICYCGVAEFVFPLSTLDNETIGFISVTGFRADRDQSLQRVKAVAEKYSLNEEQLVQIYDSSLSDEIPSADFIKTLILPLSCMYAVLYHECYPISIQKSANEDTDRLYCRIINYINSNFSNKITLDRLANEFHCSKSHINNLFTQYNKYRFSRYLTIVRIKAAKNLLENTGLSVQEIAFTTGFSDPNYFTSVFRKETGMNPSHWRSQYQRKL